MSANTMRGSPRGLIDTFLPAGMTRDKALMLSVPAFLVAEYAAFSFVGLDWGWFGHFANDASSAVEVNRAFNSAMGRFFYVLLSVGYIYMVYSKIRAEKLDRFLEETSNKALDPSQVEEVNNCVESIMSGWSDHFKSDALEIEEAYVGRDKKQASDTLKNMLSMTVEQLSTEVQSAISASQASKT
jgi:hypothetical protein